jgi:hypothetical protein
MNGWVLFIICVINGLGGPTMQTVLAKDTTFSADTDWYVNVGFIVYVIGLAFIVLFNWRKPTIEGSPEWALRMRETIIPKVVLAMGAAFLLSFVILKAMEPKPTWADRVFGDPMENMRSSYQIILPIIGAVITAWGTYWFLNKRYVASAEGSFKQASTHESTIIWKCPNCGETTSLHHDYRGKMAQCLECKKVSRV